MAPLPLIVRSAEGLTLLGGESEKLQRLACAGASVSKDGSELAVITGDGVDVFDPVTCNKIQSFRLDVVVAAVFSSAGSFLQIFRKATGPEDKNVGIWDVKTGEAVVLFYQKNFSKSSWPILQFSDDDSVACRLATNSVQIYDAKNFAKGAVDHLRLPGIQAVKLSPASPSYLATFIPESKGQPAVVQIYDRKEASKCQALARRSFFKSSSVTMTWNAGSTGLLVLAVTDDDKSNQSYYGDTKLYYLKSDGTCEGTVPLNKEGPIHDAQWSPTGKEFIVVYGYMPAKAALFDTQCRQVFDFGSGPYNTVRWNPFGSFICLAGFGNLPGDMVFWDRNTLKSIGNTKSPCSVTCEWAPDGRLLMTATTAPRMRVDNGIRIFKYTGALLEEQKINDLYQADWLPGQYVERPASPVSAKSSQKEKQPSAAAIAKPAAYRPPHSSMSASVRAQLFGEEDSNAGSGLSKSALKNKKRREKQKEKSETLPDAPEVVKEVNSETSSGDEFAKKIRALNKKLRQIEELKNKLSGQTPSQEQKSKLQQEALLREEIRKLELSS
ncbi:eukaryotic translation initiation factor 2A [Selaginella moellendorffii]|uniref:eukaryotic translation initiation factor 2A n=1 Tax=Selaginella moellendorffii TaxID=88036 RepID=UPI000D1CBF6E|nr:eukaryotic translation initiation factor 2A [Selaginella moellendorffii]|eukprot:XP_024536257.1 eukaryotic translation initiation factor 2A [Selaginella moellendorffii]